MQISMKLLLRLIEKEIYIKQDTFDRINWFMLSLLGYTSDARYELGFVCSLEIVGGYQAASGC
jgi:hypothetical protein